MIYRFDDFLLDPGTRELRKAGEPIALPARAFDCLAYLIEHRERAVGRDELIAAVWGRAEISEALLSHTIVKIRRGLGDTGNEQRTVRTVPRFGYRWGSTTTVESGAAEAAPIAVEPVAAIEEPALPSVPAVEIDGATTAPLPLPRPASPRRPWLALGIAAAMLLAAVAGLQWLRQAREAAVVPRAAETVPAAPVLVLPAEIDAPDEWRWLRFGLMDLVANQLRDGAVPTAPSESVVGLLKQRPALEGEALLNDASLAQFATLRVLPRVRLQNGRWQVHLEGRGTQRSLAAEAEADDAIQAARLAADALLRKLGRTPSTATASASPALDELLQRSGAAMLADQLEQARDLVARAPAALQQEPKVQQRMAQIELRAGDNVAVETRLHALLDRLPPGHDDAVRARAMLTLAASHVRRGQFDRALELYEETIALRQGQEDHTALGMARLGRGTVLAQRGHFDEGTAELSRARTELEAVGDGLGVASVDVNLGEFQQMRHRPADALPILKNAARQFERLGVREGRTYALAQQLAAETELLDADAALATSERFWPPESNTSNQRMRWTLTAARAAALLGVGRTDDSEALIARIRNESDLRQDGIARSHASLLAARIAFLRGDAKTAAALAEAALTPALRNEDPAGYTRGQVLHARALRGSGRLADAASTTQTLSKDSAGDEWLGMYANLAAAEQAEAERRREPALSQFALAMQAAERSNVPEDLVAVGAAYLEVLIDASQLDTARAVSGRIAMWADHDPRAAGAQARLFRAIGQDDAARKAEQSLLRARQSASTQPP